MKVAGHKQTLAPGESVTTPKAFVGLFSDDLDEAGNEVLDWQYRYLWDYTREPWFPAIRVLGYWMKGTGWGQPGVGWTGGSPDMESTFRKVFRVADLLRYALAATSIIATGAGGIGRAIGTGPISAPPASICANRAWGN